MCVCVCMYILLMLLGKIRDLTIRTPPSIPFHSIPHTHTFNNMFSFLLFSAKSVCALSNIYIFFIVPQIMRHGKESAKQMKGKKKIQNKHIVFARVCMCAPLYVLNFYHRNRFGFGESNIQNCGTSNATQTHTHTMCIKYMVNSLTL